MRVEAGSSNAVVFVDGLRVDEAVIMADEELGRVAVFELNRFGQPIFVNGRIRTRVDAGRVTIVRTS